MRIVRSSLVAALFGVAALATGADARADITSNICFIDYFASTPGYGNFGHLVLYMDNGGACSVSSAYVYCSTGATNTLCDAGNLLRESAMQSLWQNLVVAKSQGKQVTAFGASVFPFNFRGTFVRF